MRSSIGKFGFINNFMPYYKLEIDGNYEVIEADPKKLSEMFEMNKLIYAPLPAFFVLKKGYKPAKFCVAADGEVYSVIIISKKKKLDDEPIAVTSKSMTSAAMMNIIKAEKNLKNKLVVVDGSFEKIMENFDHALVIGDDAIKARTIYRVLMDLGEEWKEVTGLPAVFGVAVDRENVDEDVMKSLEWGRKHIDEIAEVASNKFKLPKEFLKTYFSKLIHELGTKEERSLKVFEEMCHEYKLL